MNKNRILIILTLLCLGLGHTSYLQAQTNLLFDGEMEVRERLGFEDVVDGVQIGGEESPKPLYWYIKSAFDLHTIELQPEYRRPGTKGQYGMMASPSEDGFVLRNVKWDWGRDDYKLVLLPDTEYKYSFWVKSEQGKGKLVVKIEFGRRAWAKSTKNDPINISDTITPTQTWQKVEGTFKTPTHEEVKYSQFIISLEEGYWEVTEGVFDSEKYYFDDAALYLASDAPSDGPVATLPALKDVKTRAFQREIELSWSGSSEDTTWEVYLGESDKLHLKSKEAKAVVDGLQPGTEYKLRVRAVKGEEFSEWYEETIKTNELSVPANDKYRTPYLRTITMSGQVPLKLPLYFHDLYGESPKVTVTVDGKPAKVQDNHIHFTWNQPPGEHYQRHTVEIVIDEGNEKTFTLTYYLTVTDNLNPNLYVN